jgi:hypothetical protein
MMLASSIKPLRNKEDQETARRKRTIEREKCQRKPKTRKKKKKIENKMNLKTLK